MFDKDVDRDIFLSLIQNGQGFSKACLRLGLAVKEASEYYERNDEFKKIVDHAFKLGLVDIASLRSKALKRRRTFMLVASEKQLLLEPRLKQELARSELIVSC